MADVLLGVPNSSYIIFSNITGYGYNFTHNVDLTYQQLMLVLQM